MPHDDPADRAVRPMTAARRIGADIGGTFTDVAFVGSDGQLEMHKVASTPPDFGRAVSDVIATLRAAGAADATTEVIHGTTVATNAILERRGARTALITTKGFRDVLELRRARSPELYDALYTPPPPLVPRRWRVEVGERIGPAGEVLTPLDEDEARRLAAFLRDEGIESLAVSLLHSFRNAAHERAVGRIVGPAIGYTSLSCDLLPVIGEYERTSTTVVNAYIGPLVSRYLTDLGADLRRIAGLERLTVMQSSGGLMSAERATREPAQIAESGPAGGVIAGARLGAASGVPDLITLDMGGTTAKASIIEGGLPALTNEYEIGSGLSLSSRLSKGRGYALKLPVLEIAEVGAGGGSIVRADTLGAILVGPQSAGAVPGPACYDAGGTLATVTDANVVLGFVNPDAIAGGSIRIHPSLARRVIHEQVAAPLGLGVDEAAHGVFGVAVASMTRAVKAVTTFRGRDPRDFTLLAFGGNGPIFATALAESLGMRRVRVPAAAGVFSALGLLEAEETWHRRRSLFELGSRLDPADLASTYAALERDVREAMAAAGADETDLRWTADVRYAQQGYELAIDVDRATSADAAATLPARLREAFDTAHARSYGHASPNDEIELVTVGVTARVPLSGGLSRVTRPDAAASGRRSCWFGPSVGRVDVPIVGRAALRAPIVGPVLVEEFDTTTVVPPRWRAALDDTYTIVLEHLR
jgi:N-methylhydantoinase A